MDSYKSSTSFFQKFQCKHWLYLQTFYVILLWKVIDTNYPHTGECEGFYCIFPHCLREKCEQLFDQMALLIRDNGPFTQTSNDWQSSQCSELAGSLSSSLPSMGGMSFFKEQEGQPITQSVLSKTGRSALIKKLKLDSIYPINAYSLCNQPWLKLQQIYIYT